MRIQPIVEGHGEVFAAPELLRRLLYAAEIYHVGVNKPIRTSKGRIMKEDTLRKYISLAKQQDDCRGILILLDADDDCPKTVAPQILSWAKSEALDIPCSVVIANREYEAWFLAGLESLRGIGGIRPDAMANRDPELLRDAKGALEEKMIKGRTYIETMDQLTFTACFDLKAAFTRCRSFRHLVASLGAMLSEMGLEKPQLPPDDWREVVG